MDWLMRSGAEFSTVLKIQQHNDFVKPQVRFQDPAIQTKVSSGSYGNR
jgi:hypothetical protein